MSIQKTAGRPLSGTMNAVLRISLCAALLALVSCGADQGSSGAGSLSFNVQWQAAPGPASAAAALAPLDCSASGVSQVAAVVHDSNNAVTATGGPWECAAHAGSITDVPPGSSLTVLILGKDGNGIVLYRGEQTGLSVSNGQHTAAGVIVVSPFAPTLASPAEGSSLTSGYLRLEWTGAGSSYQVQVSASAAFDPVVIDDVTSAMTYTSAAPLPSGAYYWRVKATDAQGNVSNWSTASGFTVLPPSTPVLSAPSEGASVVNGDFTFSWTGSGSSFRIQVSSDASFASTAIDDTSAVLSYSPKSAFPAGTYYWRVQALDASGSTSDWSNVLSFSVTSPAAPVLSAPSEGASVMNGDFIFSWTGSGSSFRLQVSSDTSFALATIDDTSTVMSYTQKIIFPAGTYYWRVQALDTVGNTSDWSNVSSFIVASAACTALPAPSQVSAEPGTAETVVTWDAVPGALSYNIHWSTTAGAAAGGTLISDAVSPYSHTGLTNGTPYYYVVSAVNICGEGAVSSEQSATPALIVPSLLGPANGSTVNSAGLTFTWQDTGSTYSYSLQVSTDPAFGTAIIDAVGLGTPTYSPANFLADGVYYWRVQATDADGNTSPWSAVWSFTTAACPLPDMSSARSSATPGDTFVRITWTNGSNSPTSFNLYWSTSSGVTIANGTKIPGATPVYEHSGLTNGVTYYYLLTGVNACGEGLPKSVGSATPCSGCTPAF